MAVKNTADKITYIYGLIDPRDQQLRYIGKTVLLPKRRADVHRWRARVAPHKRHSMAWLLSLERIELEPEVFIIEEVAAGDDWVEAEQFWIGYFRMIGADLCNHTIGGEGQTGYKQPPEMIARRIRRGADHHSTGKAMSPHVRAALKRGGDALRADPERWKRACDSRQAAFTEEMKAARTAGLLAYMSDPEKRAVAAKRRADTSRRPEKREAVGRWSRQIWATMRDCIIAAQNVGKGEEFSRKQSEARVRLWTDPEWRARQRRTKKITDAQVKEIRLRLDSGDRVGILALEYGVDQSLISRIKSGERRK